MFRRFAEKVVSSMFLQKVFCISLLFMTITAAVFPTYHNDDHSRLPSHRLSRKWVEKMKRTQSNLPDTIYRNIALGKGDNKGRYGCGNGSRHTA